MRKILYIIALALFTVGCYSDKSSMVYPSENDRHRPLVVNTSTRNISVEAAEEFVFKPEIIQPKEYENRPLQFVWKLNMIVDDKLEEQITVGNEHELRYSFPELGTYFLTLEIINEDFTQVENWSVVSRVFDEGYMVTGNNDAGEVDFAFGRKLSETDKENGLTEISFVNNLLENRNPNHDFKDIVYISKSQVQGSQANAKLFIFTRTHIYVANPSTFIVEAASPFYEMNSEYIEKVHMVDYQTSVGSYIFTSKGNIYNFDRDEAYAYLPPYDLGVTMDKCYTTIAIEGTYNYTQGYIAVKKESGENKLYTTASYPGGVMIHNNTHGVNSETGVVEDNVRENIYAGYDIDVVFQMMGNRYDNQKNDYISISRKRSNPNEVRIVKFQKSVGYRPPHDVDMPGAITDYTATNFTFDAAITPIASPRYEEVYYVNNNKLYRWRPYAVGVDGQLPTEPIIDFTGTGKEITTMTLSFNTRELYVGFYDTNTSKGGFWIYECANLDKEPIKKYENILNCRPKQILYKTLGLDRFNAKN